MIKIHIHRSWEKPSTSLWVFSRMTPGRSCKWKDMVAVEDWREADFIVVMDETNVKFPADRLIYLGSHPPNNSHYVNYENRECVASIDLKDEPGFNEWWLDLDYDELVDLKPPKKTKKLICIISSSMGQPYHTFRMDWIKEFCKKDLDNFELYGRIPVTSWNCRYHKGALGNGHIDNLNGNDGYRFGKEYVYDAAEYALEFDAGPVPHYFSERLLDSLLLWCKPIHWGCTNLHHYFPQGSFRYLEDDVLEYLDDYEISLEAMAEARELILNKYQLWPTLYRIIQGL